MSSKRGMFHKIKVGFAKNTSKKQVVQSNESLQTCQNTLKQWKDANSALIGVVDANTSYWSGILNSYNTLDTTGSAVFAENDGAVLTTLRQLQESKVGFDSSLQSDPARAKVMQRLEGAKAQAHAVNERIVECESTISNLIQNIIQANYYEGKFQNLKTQEQRRKNPNSAKQDERMSRNESNRQNTAAEVFAMTTKVREEMDVIDKERLVAADNVVAAFFAVQRMYFQCGVVNQACDFALKYQLGSRTPPRSTHQAWNIVPAQPPTPPAPMAAPGYAPPPAATPQYAPPAAPYNLQQTPSYSAPQPPTTAPVYPPPPAAAPPMASAPPPMVTTPPPMATTPPVGTPPPPPGAPMSAPTYQPPPPPAAAPRSSPPLSATTPLFNQPPPKEIPKVNLTVNGAPLPPMDKPRPLSTPVPPPPPPPPPRPFSQPAAAPPS